MIKAIIFDCFGVLTADSWHEFRIGLPSDKQNQASELNRQYCAGALSKEDFLKSVAHLTGYTEDSIHQLIDNENQKNTPLLEYIKQLHQDYKIGLLSNVASNWICDHLLIPEEQALFDEMIFSYEVGMTKPDPRIFALMCERLRVEPNEAVMVDDIERYCEAARDSNMQAVVYGNLLQLKRDIDHILNHV